MSLEGRLQSLDGRAMVFAEGIAISDGTLEDGMIEIDFRLSTSGEEVTVEETIAAGSVFRIPKAGELALIGFVDGDRNEGYIVGWIPRPGNSPAPSISPGTVYVYAKAGEEVRIVSDSGVTVEAPQISLGGDGAVSPVALAPIVDALFLRLYGVFTAWVPGLGDTQVLPLKLLLTAAFPIPPESVASSKTTSE